MANDERELSKVFRESFLRCFRRPEEQAALRVVDELGAELVIEGRGLIDPFGETNWPARQVDGAIADLHQAIDNLSELVDLSDSDLAILDRRQSRLVLGVESAVGKLRPITERLDRALAVFGGEEQLHREDAAPPSSRPAIGGEPPSGRR